MVNTALLVPSLALLGFTLVLFVGVLLTLVDTEGTNESVRSRFAHSSMSLRLTLGLSMVGFAVSIPMWLVSYMM
jgi:hypothetical protein